jgi:protein TonB
MAFFLALSLLLHAMGLAVVTWAAGARPRHYGIPGQSGRESSFRRPTISASPDGMNSHSTFFRITLPKLPTVRRAAKTKDLVKAPVAAKEAEPKPVPKTVLQSRSDRSAKKVKRVASKPSPKPAALVLADVDLGPIVRQPEPPPLPRMIQPAVPVPEPAMTKVDSAPLRRAEPKHQEPERLAETTVQGPAAVPRSDRGHHRVEDLAYAPQVSEPSSGSIASRGGAGDGTGLVFNPKPLYPPEALAARQSGRVWLRVTVEPDGKVRQVSVEISTGFTLLDQSAVDTVRTWQFDPSDEAHEVLVPIKFTLPREGAY